jgi:hypothetical protein
MDQQVVVVGVAFAGFVELGPAAWTPGSAKASTGAAVVGGRRCWGVGGGLGQAFWKVRPVSPSAEAPCTGIITGIFSPPIAEFANLSGLVVA